MAASARELSAALSRLDIHTGEGSASAAGGPSGGGAAVQAGSPAGLGTGTGAAALPGKGTLYVDFYSYATSKFFLSPDHWRLDEAGSNIAQLIDAAKRLGYEEVVGVLNASRASPHNQAAWEDRRMEEVIGGKPVPHGQKILVAEMIRDSGGQVLQTLSHGKADTLAAFAHRDGANVLTANPNTLVYRHAAFEVYRDFHYSGTGELVLTPAGPAHARIPRKDLPQEMPQSVSGEHPSMVQLLRQPHGGDVPEYQRGVPSPLVRQLGNLHIAVRPLRLALYLRLRREGLLPQPAVLEKLTAWRNGAAAWDEVRIDLEALEAGRSELVASRDGLLDAPHEALAELFPQPWAPTPPGVNELDYNNHIYAMHAVVFELCCMANPGMSLLQLLSDAARSYPPREWPPVPPPPAAHSFRCRSCRARVDMQLGEVQWYQDKGIPLPRRCKLCRQQK